MPYIARHNGEKKGAFEVSHQDDANCLKCGERMRVWRESKDGTARHFKHISNIGGGATTGQPTDCSGGEGDQHRKWKNFAAERLSEAFSDTASATVEKRLYAPTSQTQCRYADAAIMFQGRDEQLGSGLAVEVQHKNRDKDTEAVTRDYLCQDVAVAWLDESDFSDTGCRLNESDFRARARERPSPLYFHHEFGGLAQYDCPFCEEVVPMHHLVIAEMDETDVKVPATLPDKYFDVKAWSIWRRKKWSARFDPPEDYLSQTDSEKRVDAHFPPNWEYPQSEFHHLGEKNIDRRCDGCGSNATVYVHETGFRCGDCGPYPKQRRQEVTQT
jgi:predicted RNA-binding Zn-ribbon protein involved in translation (DUF1610 family)